MMGKVWLDELEAGGCSTNSEDLGDCEAVPSHKIRSCIHKVSLTWRPKHWSEQDNRHAKEGRGSRWGLNPTWTAGNKECWEGEQSSPGKSTPTDNCLYQPGLLSPGRLDSAILLTQLKSLFLFSTLVFFWGYSLPCFSSGLSLCLLISHSLH